MEFESRKPLLSLLSKFSFIFGAELLLYGLFLTSIFQNVQGVADLHVYEISSPKMGDVFKNERTYEALQMNI